MGLSDRVTGSAKLQIIDRERERSGVELSDPKIALITCSITTPTYNCGSITSQARGHFTRMGERRGHQQCLTRSAATTRAHMRGNFIKAAKEWRRVTRLIGSPQVE